MSKTLFADKALKTFKGIMWQDKEPVCIKHIVNKVW